jgi:hypothetical protein
VLFRDGRYLALPPVSGPATERTRQATDLPGRLEAEAAAGRERIEADGSLMYGAGAALLGDLERLGKILDALDAIAKDRAA